MDIINNNPYRIAGILSNATLRELERNKSKFLKYIEVGKQPKSDTDFELNIGLLNRSKESLQKAFSSVEQNQDKVNYSLFWFLNASPFDNTAFEYLKNGDEEKAVEIWEKVTTEKEVNSKNFSAFNNLGTYKLLSKNKSDIKSGIEAKIKLIESDYFENFVHSVADETYTIDKQKQSEKLIDELLTQFKKQYSSSETMQLFSGCNGTTQQYLSKKFTEEPLHKIENQIESCKKKRKASKGNAYEYGLKLFTNTKEDLSLLKSLLGTSDLKYKSVADQLANEIMQCGIDYFKEWQDIKDPSEEGLKLLKYAKSIAIGNITKDRIKQNFEGIQEWAETAPIKEDLVYITDKLKSFQDLNNSMANAKALVLACKSSLRRVRDILGANDEFYLNISSAVVNNALGMVIDVVNEAQSGLEYDSAKLILLPNIVSEAITVVSSFGVLDMNSQTRIRYNENKTTITNMDGQLNRIRRQTTSYSSQSSSYASQSSSRSTSSDDEGCAPWVYIVGAVIFFIILANACN